MKKIKAPRSFNVSSHTMVFGDFETEWYSFWADELKQKGAGLQKYKLRANKFWQNAAIAQILNESNVLKSGSSAIGFGVGKERLPALFADRGVSVLATDQDFRKDKAKLWAAEELAKNLGDLNSLSICSESKFKKHVILESLDMNNLPNKHVGKFDFAWSNCALGHLGSIEAGLKFIVNSAKYLKPGGVAVHTTEVNVLSNGSTVDSGGTVIFRPKDLLKLSVMLRRKGFDLEIPRFDFGTTKEDERLSFKPEFGNDYSKILVAGHLATQIVLIVRRRSSAKHGSLLPSAAHMKAYAENCRVQKRFIKNHPTLSSMLKASHVHIRGGLEPVSQSYDVRLKQKEDFAYVEFQNLSPYYIFSAHTRLHDIQPIVLATDSPMNRHSIFFADNWLNNSPARAPSAFYKKTTSGKWEEIPYVEPGKAFAFKVTLNPSKAKKNKLYSEEFSLVQETVGNIPETKITINVKV